MAEEKFQQNQSSRLIMYVAFIRNNRNWISVSASVKLWHPSPCMSPFARLFLQHYFLPLGVTRISSAQKKYCITNKMVPLADHTSFLSDYFIFSHSSTIKYRYPHSFLYITYNILVLKKLFEKYYVDIHVIYSRNRVRTIVYVVPHVYIMKYHTTNLTGRLTKLELKHFGTF